MAPLAHCPSVRLDADQGGLGIFLNVLIGVDGSRCGRDAIALAGSLVSRRGRLTLAHVDPMGSGAAPQGSRAESLRMLSRERMHADVDAELLSVSATSAGGGLHVLAEELDSDLLVVGSCGRAGAGRAMLGDDTRAALNGAPCPVAIASAGYARDAGRLQRVGVAYNRSRESEAALSMAREIAASSGAAVSAMEVVPVMGEDSSAFIPLAADEPVDVMLREAGEHMDRLPGVEGHVAYGLVGEELAAFGSKVDILLVGSRGYGPIRRVMLGNTSDYLERRACCSLLVLTRSPAMRPARDADTGLRSMVGVVHR